MKENLQKQLELYSNSIIAFAIFQGLVYCYYMGTNTFFISLLKRLQSLSISIVLFQTFGLILSVIATLYIRDRVVELIDMEYREMIRKIFLGKLIVLVTFGLLPIINTLIYAILFKSD